MIKLIVTYVDGKIGKFEFRSKEDAEHVLNKLQETGMWKLIKSVQIEED